MKKDVKMHGSKKGGYRMAGGFKGSKSTKYVGAMKKGSSHKKSY